MGVEKVLRSDRVAREVVMAVNHHGVVGCGDHRLVPHGLHRTALGNSLPPPSRSCADTPGIPSSPTFLPAPTTHGGAHGHRKHRTPDGGRRGREVKRERQQDA